MSGWQVDIYVVMALFCLRRFLMWVWCLRVHLPAGECGSALLTHEMERAQQMSVHTYGAVTQQITKNIVDMIWNFWVNKLRWARVLCSQQRAFTRTLSAHSQRLVTNIKSVLRYTHGCKCSEHVHQVGVRDRYNRSYDPRISDLIEPTNNRVIY